MVNPIGLSQPSRKYLPDGVGVHAGGPGKGSGIEPRPQAYGLEVCPNSIFLMPAKEKCAIAVTNCRLQHAASHCPSELGLADVAKRREFRNRERNLLCLWYLLRCT